MQSLGGEICFKSAIFTSLRSELIESKNVDVYVVRAPLFSAVEAPFWAPMVVKISFPVHIFLQIRKHLVGARASI